MDHLYTKLVWVGWGLITQGIWLSLRLSYINLSSWCTPGNPIHPSNQSVAVFSSYQPVWVSSVPTLLKPNVLWNARHRDRGNSPRKSTLSREAKRDQTDNCLTHYLGLALEEEFGFIVSFPLFLGRFHVWPFNGDIISHTLISNHIKRDQNGTHTYSECGVT